MRVTHLALHDFRSYREQVIELPAGVVVFEGANGRGKTNAVEAIAYLSTFSSHRTASSAPLVRIGKSDEDQPGGAVVRARMDHGERSVLLELEIARGRANRARVNKSNVSPRDLLGRLRTVVFAPEDLELLRGDPAIRRRFLDEIITKLKPHFLGVRQDFEKVLRQRAAALKQLGFVGYPLPEENEALLEVWDSQLASLSAQIAAHRRAVARALAPLIDDVYHQITDGDRQASLEYTSHLEKDEASLAPTETGGDVLQVVNGRIEGSGEEEIAALTARYKDALRALRQQELRRGVNLEGAHRDDLLISLDDLPVKNFASHGELWSSALMLRWAEMELLRLDGEFPVLILDDVFAELDVGRRKGLLDLMTEVEQVLITVAVGTEVPPELHAHRLYVTRDDVGLSHVSEVDDERG